MPAIESCISAVLGDRAGQQPGFGNRTSIDRRKPLVTIVGFKKKRSPNKKVPDRLRQRQGPSLGAHGALPAGRIPPSGHPRMMSVDGHRLLQRLSERLG